VIGDSEFRTKNFTESAWKQSAPVKVTGSVVGRVEVGYLEERPEESEGPFLKEERLLIDAIAKRLGRIAERKRAEEELRQSEEKFAKAFHSSPDPISITTLKEGRYLDVNDSFLHATGYRPDEVIGRTTLELGLWARSEESGRVIRMVQTKGRVSNLELDFRMKSGQIRTGLVSSCNSKRYDVYCLHGRESKSNYLDGGRAPATGIVDSQRNHGAAPCATGPHRTGSSGGKDDQGDRP